MNIEKYIRNKIDFLIKSIDLNYILAESRKERYQIRLFSGSINGNINWSNNVCYLSYNYEQSVGLIYWFVSKNVDKIIRLNISSTDHIYPLDRNMIIYYDDKISIDNIKKHYESIVIF
jgi:hypothetical protein